MAKCCVRGCSNKLEVGSKIRMFRFPALLEKPKGLVELSRQRRNAWLIALNRTNLPEEVLKSIGICSEHFVTGSPARLKDNTEVDWIPTIKMGNQQRNRIEKKIISPTQTTKLKRISSIEKLSELEKLKNELKCKDAIIKNYKDESLQLKDQQKKIVNNYEERLKEKDVKIKMSIRDQSREIREPHRSESHKKERSTPVRTGRNAHKSSSKQRLIRPCVVRIRKICSVKEEPEEEEITPESFATKKNTSKQNIQEENTQRDQPNKEHISRERSFRGPASRNPTPVSLKSKGSTSVRLSNSPKPTSRNSEELLLPKPASKKAEDFYSSKSSGSKIEDEPLPIKLSSRKVDENFTPKGNAKKVEESLSIKSTSKKSEENQKLASGKLEDNLPSKSRTPVPKKVEEPVLAMASTRARRAPKPNPKYANDDIITPKLISRRDKDILVLNEAGLDTDSGDDFYYGGAGDTSETGLDEDISEAFEDNYSSDFSENGDFLLKRKRIQKPATFTSRSNTPLSKRSRTQAKGSLVQSAAQSPAVKSVEPKKLVPVSQKPMANQTQILANRKRKLEEGEASRKEPPESIIARNKRLNIALYDSNDARPASPLRTPAPKHIAATAQTKTHSSQATNVLATKRQMPGPLSSKIVSPLSTVKEKSHVKSNLPSTQKKSLLSKEGSSEIVDPANTQDDFETMPTFTIVNINDIINKKGDSLVQKRSEDEHQDGMLPNSLNRVNRRKTGHTTILSEKIDSSKSLKPLSKTPLQAAKKSILQSNTPQTKQQQRISQTPLERREAIRQMQLEKPSPIVEKKSPNVDKPAPRILNSVVGKKTFPVQPILSKFENDLDRESNEDANEKSVMVKENLGSNKVMPTKPTPVRKLPAEKVCVQRQGNKLIKKITCFETWYVINIPETQEVIVKNILDIPLITLANSVKTIKLPSSSWSSKVTLYKLSSQMVNKSFLTPYTGEISDQSIKEEDREKYQPSCVMFRRMTQQKSQTRMPYDRAVIFKMKTFFTNIDGKNVRLIGAPNKINSFEDIEVLLELVDELDLLHEFVETASTV